MEEVFIENEGNHSSFYDHLIVFLDEQSEVEQP